MNFDKNGHLFPEEIISSDILDFERSFVFNPHRARIFEAFWAYSSGLKVILGGRKITQWINGSFVTLEPEPRDIDLVTFITLEESQIFGSELAKTDKHNGLVDAYLVVTYPQGHPSAFFQASDEAYWRNHFHQTRKRKGSLYLKKGFLEISY